MEKIIKDNKDMWNRIDNLLAAYFFAGLLSGMLIANIITQIYLCQ